VTEIGKKGKCKEKRNKTWKKRLNSFFQKGKYKLLLGCGKNEF
jgi:hypothetical protein